MALAAAPDGALLSMLDNVRAAVPSSARVELVDGQITVNSPRPKHQLAVLRLTNQLQDRLGDGFVVFPATDMAAGDAIVIPDVTVVSAEDAAEILDTGDVRIPVESALLVVEVLSPSTASTDRGPKRRLFQQQHVDYWIAESSDKGDPTIVERFDYGGGRFN